MDWGIKLQSSVGQNDEAIFLEATQQKQVITGWCCMLSEGLLHPTA